MPVKEIIKIYKEDIILNKIHGRKDKGGRWYPDEDLEKCSCCRYIRSPSRSWPNNYLNHCRTNKHLRTRLLEKPSIVEKEALSITLETAPLYLNHQEDLLRVTAEFFLKNKM